MAVLEGLEPQEVFRWFEAICGIPHGSSDTGRISDFLVDFAVQRGLKYRQDEWNNVIIFLSFQFLFYKDNLLLSILLFAGSSFFYYLSLSFIFNTFVE